MPYEPITSQPMSFEGYAPSAPITQPKGLEALADFDQIIVDKEIKLSECKSTSTNIVSMTVKKDNCSLWEKKGTVVTASAVNGIGDSHCASIQLWVKVHPRACCCCADTCSLYPIFVKDANGQKIGMVRPTTYCCSPRFGIFDVNNTPLYTISGQCCFCQFCCCKDDIDFPVMALGDRTGTANIAKRWTTCFRESFTDASKFAVTVPRLMQVQHKALILASVFMIDYNLYEIDKHNNLG